MPEILRLSEIPAQNKTSVIDQIENIFFLSSSLKNFSSEEKRRSFFKRWCGDYQRLFPQEFFIIIENNQVLGYLSGCSNTLQNESFLEVPGLSVFHDLFEKFPAHLHINFHPDARGKGLGSLLVNHYIKILQEKNVQGLFLVTSPDALNVSFYQRLGFNNTYTREFNGMALYFMGTQL